MAVVELMLRGNTPGTSSNRRCTHGMAKTRTGAGISRPLWSSRRQPRSSQNTTGALAKPAACLSITSSDLRIRQLVEMESALPRMLRIHQAVRASSECIRFADPGTNLRFFKNIEPAKRASIRVPVFLGFAGCSRNQPTGVVQILREPCR